MNTRAFSSISLIARLTLIGALVLLVVLGSVSGTLYLNHRITGGAAAVNEAGRMRMNNYRLALLVQQGGSVASQREAMQHLDASLQLLLHGDRTRPLAMPDSAGVRERFAHVQELWTRQRQLWMQHDTEQANATLVEMVQAIDALVAAMEVELESLNRNQRNAQIMLFVLTLGSALALLLVGRRYIVRPINQLRDGFQQIENGNMGARARVLRNDELGELARSFNHMAARLQALCLDLQGQVDEQTVHLQRERTRLAALYEASSSLAHASTLEEMATAFAHQIKHVAGADAVAVRFADEAHQRFLMLASIGMSRDMCTRGDSLPAGLCDCGQVGPDSTLRVVPIRRLGGGAFDGCARAGFETLVSIPMVRHERTLGEVDLFYRQAHELESDERSLLDALTSHLAAAMEGQRAISLEMEAAVSQERSLLAQELHDSIAQSLAFLKIQLQLLHDARDRGDAAGVQRIMAELELGVNESYSDVRELLVHFRTRASEEDVEMALRTTLRKFEHQSGIATTFESHGHGLPLLPDVQIQVLHVLQEALSNARKHASASCVHLRIAQTPQWRFELQDDGIGFASDKPLEDETHVGLRIMHERAARIGAAIEVHSQPGQGTRVVLVLPAAAVQTRIPT